MTTKKVDKADSSFKPSGLTYERKVEILNNIRAYIVTKDRALSGLLTFVHHRVVPDDDPMYETVAFATGNKMHFGDLYFSQPRPIMGAILLHEMLHIVFRHIHRGRGRIFRLFNIAADAIINDSIGYKDEGTYNTSNAIYLNKDECVSLQSVFEELDMPSENRLPLCEWTTESLYECLIKRLKEQLEEQLKQKQGKKGDTKGNGEGDSDSSTSGNSQSQTGPGSGGGGNSDPSLGEIEKAVEELLDKLAEKHKMFAGDDLEHNAGDVDAADIDEVDESIWSQRFDRARQQGFGTNSILNKLNPDVYKPQVKWSTVLRRYLVKHCMPDTQKTYLKPNRRMTSLRNLNHRRGNYGGQVYLPGTLNRKGLDKMVVIIDTSGSCFTPKELNEFCTEIESVQKTTGVEIQLIFADTKVTAEYSVKNDGKGLKDKMKSGQIQAKGGGGTDMVAPFMYAKEKYRPVLIVIATDGYTDFPTKAQMRGSNLVWVINTDIEAPPHCGVTVHIKSE